MSTGAFFIDKIIVMGYMQVYSDRQKQNLAPQSAVANIKKKKSEKQIPITYILRPA